VAAVPVEPPERPPLADEPFGAGGGAGVLTPPAGVNTIEGGGGAGGAETGELTLAGLEGEQSHGVGAAGGGDRTRGGEGGGDDWSRSEAGGDTGGGDTGGGEAAGGGGD
jgi:hypothetical protein